MARTDVDPLLIQAAVSNISTPVLSARIVQPSDPSNILDLTPYIVSCEVTMPPSLKPAILHMTLSNPKSIVSLSSLFRADYELDIALGYFTQGKKYIAPIGRFWMDAPQRTLTADPPADTIVLQARDGFKLWLEREFESDEHITLINMTLRQALIKAASYITVAGVQTSIIFDNDPDTVYALAQQIVTHTAGPLDNNKTAMHLLIELLAPTKLQAIYRYDGVLRIGLMNQQSPVIGIVGGRGTLRRPIYFRDVRHSTLNTHNAIYVFGTRVFATAEDTNSIYRVGRRKALFVNQPIIQDQKSADILARQELDLSERFTEQPDMTTPWLPDIERRDLVDIDDSAAMGLERAVYRVEDIVFKYTSGTSPTATMQLGMGLPFAPLTDTTSGSY